MNYAKEVSAAHDALALARKLFLEATGAENRSAKQERDFATGVDYAIEIALRGHFARNTPDIPFLGEEYGGAHHSDARYWVLDPIDGTMNYANGLPLCGIALALVEEGRATLGFIDLPYLNERYEAQAGGGATCNGRTLRVSQTSSLDHALVAFGDFATGEGATEKNAERLQLAERMAAQVLRVRMLGSSAIDLAWVAAGRLDACIALGNKPWDVQAGALLVREAGGCVFDRDGTPHTTASACTLASPRGLQTALLGLFTSPSAPSPP